MLVVLGGWRFRILTQVWSMTRRPLYFLLMWITYLTDPSNKPPFLEDLSSAGILNDPLSVIGGDLNFTLSLWEVEGPHPREDRQGGFFHDFLVNHHLVDMEPGKLVPT